MYKSIVEDPAISILCSNLVSTQNVVLLVMFVENAFHKDTIYMIIR